MQRVLSRCILNVYAYTQPCMHLRHASLCNGTVVAMAWRFSLAHHPGPVGLPCSCMSAPSSGALLPLLLLCHTGWWCPVSTSSEGHLQAHKTTTHAMSLRLGLVVHKLTTCPTPPAVTGHCTGAQPASCTYVHTELLRCTETPRMTLPCMVMQWFETTNAARSCCISTPYLHVQAVSGCCQGVPRLPPRG